MGRMNPRCVRRGLLWLVLATAAGAASAQPADPLKTPECRAARTRLDVAMTAAVGRSGPSARALQAARTRVARVCFDREPDSAQEPSHHTAQDSRQDTAQDARAPYPPVQVPPVTGAVAAPARHGAPVAADPPVALPRAAVITQCDPTGCWDSTGRRLNRVGPGLAGPGGPCMVQGNAAMCP